MKFRIPSLNSQVGKVSELQQNLIAPLIIENVDFPKDVPAMLLTPIKDRQTVTPEGERLEPQIYGVEIRMVVTHADERGELCEIYNPEWAFAQGTLTYVYMATVRPRQIKGWVVHKIQD